MEYPYYESRNNLFWLVWNTIDTFCMGPEIGFVLDGNSDLGPMMLKHGDPTILQKYHKNMVDKLIEANRFDILDPRKIYIITFSTIIPTEEINKVLHISGYIKYFLEKFGSGKGMIDVRV